MSGRRAFYASLGVSALFHLSMVTLFSIVILFPRHEVQYYSLRFIDEETMRPLFQSPDQAYSSPTRKTLRVPSLADTIQLDAQGDDLLDGMDVLTPTPTPESLGLPSIDIPRLEFAELERIDVRNRSLRVRAAYGDLLDREPHDSWEWFGQELHQLRSRLMRLPGLGGEPDTPPEDTPHPVATPLPGFSAYIEWMGEPQDRKLLFSPPIEALWRLQGIQLDAPIALVFKVNPQGRVVEVIDPIDDEAGVISSAGRALFKYRFEPIDSKSGEQYGTLIISADADRAR